MRPIELALADAADGEVVPAADRAAVQIVLGPNPAANEQPLFDGV